VTKSFVSALVGIALRDRHLESLDQTVEELRWSVESSHRVIFLQNPVGDAIK
jgi:hypothetical protein